LRVRLKDLYRVPGPGSNYCAADLCSTLFAAALESGRLTFPASVSCLQVLVADINIGYEDIVNTQVLRFNGTPVKNLKHLAAMVEAATTPFLRFDLEYDQVMVLETEPAKAATPSILQTHRIPSASSDDLNK
jgi:hypothetical protein